MHSDHGWTKGGKIAILGGEFLFLEYGGMCERRYTQEDVSRCLLQRAGNSATFSKLHATNEVVYATRIYMKFIYRLPYTTYQLP